MTHWIGVSVMVLGLFLVLPLLWRSRGRGPDFGLALFLLALMLNDLTEVLPGTQDWHLRYQMMLVIASQLAYPFYGPLILNYVRRVVGRPFRKRELGHLVPAGLWVALSVLVALLLLITPEALLTSSPEEDQARPLLAGVFLLQTFLYLVVAVRTFFVHRRSASPEDGLQGSSGDRWLAFFLGGALILWSLWLASTFGNWLWVDQVLAVTVLVFFYSVGWFGWKQEALTTKKPHKKYSKSGMSSQEERLVAERVVRFVEEQKAYLREDLTLGAVAQEVGCSPQWVSQHLNETRATTFFDYVNGLRIAEFQRLAADPASKEKTVLELALAAGFRSKSTFNLAFKTKLGLTPQQWRQQRSIERPT